MAPRKKGKPGTASSGGKKAEPPDTKGKGARVPRPPFPLKINHARVFTLAAEADKTEEENNKTAAPPPLPASESRRLDELFQVVQELVRRNLEAAAPPPAPPVDASVIAEQVRAAVVGDLFRLIQELANTPKENNPPPTSPPDATEIAEQVRAAVVGALPELIRAELSEIGHTAPETAPSGPSPVERVRTWIRAELNLLALGLSTVPLPQFLDDNRKLADQVIAQAALHGQLSAVSAYQFFTVLAQEIRDLVFWLADQAQTPSAMTDVTLRTPALAKTLTGLIRESPPAVAALPPRITAVSPPITPHLAVRRFRELALLAAEFSRLERDSKIVASYYRLRTFAERTDDEIGVLTGKPREDITRLLRAFVEQFDEVLGKILTP